MASGWTFFSVPVNRAPTPDEGNETALVYASIFTLFFTNRKIVLRVCVCADTTIEDESFWRLIRVETATVDILYPVACRKCRGLRTHDVQKRWPIIPCFGADTAGAAVTWIGMASGWTCSSVLVN